MIFNWIKPIREILFSQYSKYMACSGLLVACVGYDEYRMKQICNTMAEKYSADGCIFVVANNKFMCPFTKINIYKVNDCKCSLTGKNNTLNKETPLEKKYIATELFLTTPPLIELGNEVFFCNAENCVKISKSI